MTFHAVLRHGALRDMHAALLYYHSEESMCRGNLGEFLMERWGGRTLHAQGLQSSSLLPFLTLVLVWDYTAFPPIPVLGITQSISFVSACLRGTLGWESESPQRWQ